MYTTLLDDPPNLRRGDINPAPYLDDVLNDLLLPPIMERNQGYLEMITELFGCEEVVGFWVHCSPISFFIL